MENTGLILSTSVFVWKGDHYFSRTVDFGDYLLIQIYVGEGPWKDLGRYLKKINYGTN